MARNDVTSIPPGMHNHFRVPEHAEDEDPSPCLEAHTSPAVGDVTLPAITTGGHAELQGSRVLEELWAKLAHPTCDRKEHACHCSSGIVSYRERQ